MSKIKEEIDNLDISEERKQAGAFIAGMANAAIEHIRSEIGGDAEVFIAIKLGDEAATAAGNMDPKLVMKIAEGAVKVMAEQPPVGATIQ